MDSEDLLFIAVLGVIGYIVLKGTGQSQIVSQAIAPVQGDVEDTLSQVGNYVENAITGSTRGERNNNPGNIRLTSPQIPWEGMSPTQTDPAFVQFIDPQHGIRAMRVNFQTYYNNYGINTVTGIISRWAPPSENNTAAYITQVANQMGVDPNATLDLTDPGTIAALVDAVITHENGSDPYLASGVLQQGLSLA